MVDLGFGMLVLFNCISLLGPRFHALAETLREIKLPANSTYN